MPKANPISLHPLTFHEALKHLVRVDPEKVGLKVKQGKRKRRKSGTRHKTAGKRGTD
jgi:hypothetical protein